MYREERNHSEGVSCRELLPLLGFSLLLEPMRWGLTPQQGLLGRNCDHRGWSFLVTGRNTCLLPSSCAFVFSPELIYILQFEVCTLWYILLPVPFLSFQFLLLGNRYVVILIVLLREICSFGFRKKHGMSNNLAQKEHI